MLREYIPFRLSAHLCKIVTFSGDCHFPGLAITSYLGDPRQGFDAGFLIYSYIIYHVQFFIRQRVL